MTAPTATDQVLANYRRNREGARAAADRVRQLQRLMLLGADVSSALDDAILAERVMRLAHEQSCREVIAYVLPGLLTTAAAEPTQDEQMQQLDTMEGWPQ